MKTVTWGTGGTYLNLKAALDASVFDDDYLYSQVGVSTDSTEILWGFYDFAGHSIIVDGNGDLATFSTQFYRLRGSSSELTGNLIFQNLNFSSPRFLYLQDGVYTGTYTLAIKYCKGDLPGSQEMFDISENLIKDIQVYCCDINSGGRWLYIDQFAGSPENQVLHIEDCIFRSGDIILSGGTAPCNNIYLKRVYLESDSNDTYLSYFNYNNFYDELYVSGTNMPVLTHYDYILENEVESVDPVSDLYYVPKATSDLYTTASQGSNIPDNVIGLNIYPVTNRAVGPYTPPLYIYPPTGISVSYDGTGAIVTWTDYSPAQTGYEKVYIYYEEQDVESLFITPKHVVNSGVQTYTISYDLLTASRVWYLRLTHGA